MVAAKNSEFRLSTPGFEASFSQEDFGEVSSSVLQRRDHVGGSLRPFSAREARILFSSASDLTDSGGVEDGGTGILDPLYQYCRLLGHEGRSNEMRLGSRGLSTEVLQMGP